MAGGKSLYASAATLNTWLGGATSGEPIVPPANVYVAMFTATPTAAGGGTEVTGGSYARVAVANTTANWPHATAVTGVNKSNANAIQFPTCTANWGTVTGFAIFDASSGGNMIYWGDMRESRSYSTGDSPRFNALDLVLREQ